VEWRWFVVFPSDDASGDDPSARLRRVARREGFLTVVTSYGDCPATLHVRCQGPTAEVQIQQLMELAGVQGGCVEIEF
jgi:hypothetical protein